MNVSCQLNITKHNGASLWSTLNSRHRTNTPNCPYIYLSDCLYIYIYLSMYGQEDKFYVRFCWFIQWKQCTFSLRNVWLHEGCHMNFCLFVFCQYTPVQNSSAERWSLSSLFKQNIIVNTTFKIHSTFISAINQYYLTL